MWWVESPEESSWWLPSDFSGDTADVRRAAPQNDPLAAMSTTETPTECARAPMPRVLAEVLGSPGRIAGFVTASGVVAFFYTLLLPFDYTQRFEFANWNYLSPHLLVWALALGVAMGLVLSIQVYAMRQIVSARVATGAASGAAFIMSLLPSFLCCTPMVPSLLAFVGVSGVGLYSTTGAVQHFFAVHQSEILSASLALLAIMGWWGLRKLTHSRCFTGEGCAVDTTEGTTSASGDAQADLQVPRSDPPHAERPLPKEKTPR